jgi:hypothetical protein
VYWVEIKGVLVEEQEERRLGDGGRVKESGSDETLGFRRGCLHLIDANQNPLAQTLFHIACGLGHVI